MNEVCTIGPGKGLLAKLRKKLGIKPRRRGPTDCYPKYLFVLTGAVIGIAGVLLSYLGNPPNTGFCVSCFMENIAGSLGLHQNIRMQYLRPEIMGFVIGSFVMALYKKEFTATGGSSPLLRFFVGILLIIGCAVFIGCPIKMVFRIAAGDLTAWIGVLGLVAGVAVGMQFLEKGFSLGKQAPLPAANALLMPALVLSFGALREAGVRRVEQQGAGAQYARSPALAAWDQGTGPEDGVCITGGSRASSLGRKSSRSAQRPRGSRSA
jgi:YedE family putative selenium metabolism protein